MASNTALELSDHLPPVGGSIICRLLPVAFPPLTAEAIEANQFSVRWNLTARSAADQGVVFAMLGEDPATMVHLTMALCLQFGWVCGDQVLSAEEVTGLQQRGLPLPPTLEAAARVPPRRGEDGPNLQEFTAAVWSFLDLHNRSSAALVFYQAMQSTDQDLAERILQKLPQGFRVGPDKQGRVRPVCGARRVPVTPETPSGGLLGDPCLTPGHHCRYTATGYCWRRFPFDPNLAAIELMAEAAPAEVVTDSPDVPAPTEVVTDGPDVPVLVEPAEVPAAPATKASTGKAKKPTAVP